MTNKRQLKVIKLDGDVERYMHTKVIGTISNALAEIGCGEIDTAEHLAEAVTYFLYHKYDRRAITTGEVFSIIKAVLAATQYGQAASVLSEHRCQRKLKRCRVEVVSVDIRELADAEMLYAAGVSENRSRWNKSRIVQDLVIKDKVGRQTSRVIASMVEEKVLGMNVGAVSTSLIRQLVLRDMAVVLRAERQLEAV